MRSIKYGRERQLVGTGIREPKLFMVVRITGTEDIAEIYGIFDGYDLAQDTYDMVKAQHTRQKIAIETRYLNRRYYNHATGRRTSGGRYVA